MEFFKSNICSRILSCAGEKAFFDPFHYMGKSLKEQNAGTAFPLYFSDTEAAAHFYLSLTSVENKDMLSVK